MVYGRVNHLVDPSEVVVVEREFPLLTPKEVNPAISARCGAGWWSSAPASAPTPTRSGIDAILNIKGFAGEKGLEYYRELKVVNLGAQVAVPELVEQALTEKADAVLVSQVVTQRDAHLHNTRELSAAFARRSRPSAAAARGRRTALRRGDGGELGVDRVFGRGTTPARSPASWSTAHHPRGRKQS